MLRWFKKRPEPKVIEVLPSKKTMEFLPEYPSFGGTTIRADEDEHLVMYYIVHLSDKAKQDVRQIIREELESFHTRHR